MKAEEKKLIVSSAKVRIDILDEIVCFSLSLEAANSFLSHSIKNQWLK